MRYAIPRIRRTVKHQQQSEQEKLRRTSGASGKYNVVRDPRLRTVQEAEIGGKVEEQRLRWFSVIMKNDNGAPTKKSSKFKRSQSEGWRPTGRALDGQPLR